MHTGWLLSAWKDVSIVRGTGLFPGPTLYNTKNANKYIKAKNRLGEQRQASSDWDSVCIISRSTNCMHLSLCVPLLWKGNPSLLNCAFSLLPNAEWHETAKLLWYIPLYFLWYPHFWPQESTKLSSEGFELLPTPGKLIMKTKQVSYKAMKNSPRS